MREDDSKLCLLAALYLWQCRHVQAPGLRAVSDFPDAVTAKKSQPLLIAKEKSPSLAAEAGYIVMDPF